MSLNTNLGFIHNHEYRFAFCLCFVFFVFWKENTIDQEEIGCIEEFSCPVSSVCLCWRVVVGWSLASFIVMWLWIMIKKKSICASCFSIAHACRHLHAYYRHRNAYGWEVSKFLNHSLSSLSLPLTRLISLRASQKSRHTKSLSSHFVRLSSFPPFCLKYMSKFILLFCLCLLFSLFSSSPP